VYVVITAFLLGFLAVASKRRCWLLASVAERALK